MTKSAIRNERAERTSDRTSHGTPEWIPLRLIIAAHVLLAIILLASFLTGAHLIPLNGDLIGYAAIADDIESISEGGKSVYSGFYHYPPLANIVFLVAKKNTFGVLPYDAGLLITMILAAVGSILFAIEFLKAADLRWAFFAILLSVVLLEPNTFFARFDFFPTLAILFAMLSVKRERYAAAGVLLGAGILLKFAPVFLVPIFLVYIPRKKWLRFFVGMLSIALLVWLTYDLILGWGATTDSLIHFVMTRQRQMIYIFSTFSSIDLVLQKIVGSRSSVVWIEPILGHFNADFPVILPNILQGISGLGALLIAWHASRQPRREDHLPLYIAATLFWLLFSTSFVTMHYYLWALPFVFLWCLEKNEAEPRNRWILVLTVLATAIAVLGQYCFPYSYIDLVMQQGWLPIIANVVRNFLVFAITMACLKAAHVRSEIRS